MIHSLPFSVPSLDDISAMAATVEGWLSDAQGRALHAAAAATRRRGAIVEIGSWKGRSTLWLAHGARLAGHRVHAIDPHQQSREDPSARTLETFLANLARAGVADVVEPVVLRSDEALAVAGAVELLFIDGDHSPAGARRDVDLWLPRVMVGGVAMFHDVATSGYTGPRRMFQQRVCWSSSFHRIRRVGSMTIAERTARRSAWQAVRGTIVGILLYWYDVEGVVKRALRAMRRPLGIGRRR